MLSGLATRLMDMAGSTGTGRGWFSRERPNPEAVAGPEVRVESAKIPDLSSHYV